MKSKFVRRPSSVRPFVVHLSVASIISGPIAWIKYRLVTFGGRSFSSVVPGLRNNLPQHLRDCKTEREF